MYKRIIALLLTVLSVAFLFSACKKTVLPDDNTTETENYTDADTPTNINREWELKNLDFANVLPELMYEKVTPFEEHPAFTIDRLVSPMKFIASEEAAEVLRSIPFYDDYILALERDESADSWMFYEESYKPMRTVLGTVVIRAFKEGETNYPFTLSYSALPGKIDGANNYSFVYTNIDMNDENTRNAIYDTVKSFCGEGVAEVLLYGQDSNNGANMNKKVYHADSTDAWYKIERILNGDTTRFSVSVDANLTGNKLSQYSGDYEIVAGNGAFGFDKYNLEDMFGKRLGSVFVSDELNSMQTYMQIGESYDYEGTALEKYEYTNAALSDGHIYKFDSTWKKYNPEQQMSLSYGIRISYLVMEDMNDRMTGYQYEVNGFADDLKKNEGTENTDKIFESLIEDCRKQLSLVLGETVNLSFKNFENIESGKSYAVNAEFDFFGHIDKTVVQVRLYETANAYRCDWHFSVDKK